MKIIKNNSLPKFPIEVTCYHCNSILEIEKEDVSNTGYVVCPCCGKAFSIRDKKKVIEHTITLESTGSIKEETPSTGSVKQSSKEYKTRPDYMGSFVEDYPDVFKM